MTASQIDTPVLGTYYDSRFPNLTILNHPLIQHKLTHMRDKNTSTRTFRDLLREITLLMGYEITRTLPLTTRQIDTPLTVYDAPVIAGKKLAIVPVLRAGVGMSDGLLELIPSARVGHIGVYRDHESHRPVEYLVKLPPDLEERTFILCDPMVATGYSAAHAVDVLKKHGVAGDSIRFLALVAAPEGVKVFHDAHPDVHLFVASLDSHLDENAYIVPGLGDAGDRLFGTKN
ncbi:uracil phosphoribosyltransferase [Pararobbsia alpina]|uniref:Uracil phosphoribosyltransferase n=1 Tax=Pararobbsia alpina TaxID=621374 RepID=A0A6S7BFN8_9BURK|nr:uracil phosphoribosyltransferase [Pararobbsia alpina]CAB3786804.1 Uracil phosphoribosyltransferase [Pararobbsia alpina]